MSNTSTALQVDGIHVWRGDRHVLQGVSFELHPGELLHVVGPNGAGKTTLLRVVCGLLAPEDGRVRWCGADIRQDRSGYQASLAFAAHEAALKADLTPLENLYYTVGLRRRVDRQELLGHLQRTGADAYAELPARVLSAGQRRRVAMARVLATRAPLWLLDEPFSNLDDAGMQVIAALIDAHVKEGGSALVVAHHGLGTAGARQLRLAA
ncbi:MAG: cytochrome c biogenesis heme-transporting ATPase CcmA [Steroidobacteraceae bacterium]